MEHERDDYPMFGNYDSWLIDILHMLILENHNASLHAEWSSKIEFTGTNGSFGKISLHESNLHSKIQNLNANENDMCLASDQKCISRSLGITSSFLPIVSLKGKNM